MTEADTEKKQARRPEPGTRAWFWEKRVTHLSLWLTPLIPFFTAVYDFVQPAVNTKLSGQQAAAINKAYEFSDHSASTVSRVLVILDNPSLMDRFILAAPMLTATLALVLVSYALWRIEINLAAGGRPFTAKDQKTLSRANVVAAVGWVFVFMATMLTAVWFRKGPAQGFDGFGPDGDGLPLMFLAIIVLVATMERVYKKGKAAYEELEKGV